MGEFADMMLEGILCQECGTYMGEEVGYPRTCASCATSSRLPAAKVNCPTCGKRVKETGLADHQRDKHTNQGANNA